MFAKELGRRLAGTGITTYALHPGNTNTDMTHFVYKHSYVPPVLYKYVWLKVALTPTEGAQTSLFCCLDDSVSGQTGRYYSDCAEAESSVHAENEEDARRLWEAAARITGCAMQARNYDS